MKMKPVIHFEMPAEDMKRMITFYSDVFGWQTKQLGPEMGNFVTVETTESENNMLKKPGQSKWMLLYGRSHVLKIF